MSEDFPYNPYQEAQDPFNGSYAPTGQPQQPYGTEPVFKLPSWINDKNPGPGPHQSGYQDWLKAQGKGGSLSGLPLPGDFTPPSFTPAPGTTNANPKNPHDGKMGKPGDLPHPGFLSNKPHDPHYDLPDNTHDDDDSTGHHHYGGGHGGHDHGEDHGHGDPHHTGTNDPPHDHSSHGRGAYVRRSGQFLPHHDHPLPHTEGYKTPSWWNPPTSPGNEFNQFAHGHNPYWSAPMIQPDPTWGPPVMMPDGSGNLPGGGMPWVPGQPPVAPGPINQWNPPDWWMGPPPGHVPTHTHGWMPHPRGRQRVHYVDGRAGYWGPGGVWTWADGRP